MSLRISLSVIMVMMVMSIPASAQESVSGRFRVLVPQFLPMNDEDDGFGDKLADRLRDEIDELLSQGQVQDAKTLAGLLFLQRFESMEPSP